MEQLSPPSANTASSTLSKRERTATISVSEKIRMPLKKPRALNSKAARDSAHLGSDYGPGGRPAGAQPPRAHPHWARARTCWGGPWPKPIISRPQELRADWRAAGSPEPERIRVRTDAYEIVKIIRWWGILVGRPHFFLTCPFDSVQSPCAWPLPWDAEY